MTTISTPVYVIAGQSNARRLDSTRIFTDAIEARGIAGEVIRVTEGGTTMEGRETRNDWYPFEDGDPATGELVEDLIQTIRDNLAANPEAYVAGFIWMQGESDANSKFYSDDYQAKLQGLYDLVTAEFGANFPFMVMQLSDFAPGISEGNVGDWESVAAAQASFVANNSNTILLDPDVIASDAGIDVSDMFRDNFHFQDTVYSVMAETILDMIAAHSTSAAPLLSDGTSAPDQMTGSPGADIMKGHKGADTISAYAGDDLVEGGNGADVIDLGRGADLAYGGRGFDKILAGRGNDVVWAGRGNDNVAGSDGADTIYGGNGNDRIVGGKQNDALFGGNGFDELVGGKGDDLLTGGAGIDTFIFRFQQQNGYDTILDFETGLDRLQIEGGGNINDVVLTDLGDRVQITINAISFEIMTDAGQSLSLDDFLFV
ncbi:MAG: hypothetical protein GXP03_05585 [Alphaproteobacteria bacterium]|nr:hypothetical protein [Alphaproteobacteria bacterium]